jgi:hypothetical protein
VALHRRDPKGPLTARLLFALGIAAVLFLVRGVAWWSQSDWLDRLALIPAALVPLGALVVTEGILRRHAPKPFKIAAVGGGVLLAVLSVFGPDNFSKAYSLTLSLFQLSGFATCALLLATRDRASLLASENRGIARLAIGALLVIPFIVTDFVALAPHMPVRLGALGALLVVTAVVIANGAAGAYRQEILLTALRLTGAVLLGMAAACLSPDVDAAQVVRFCAISVCGVLTIGLMADTVRALFEAKVPGVLNALAASGARTRDELFGELVRNPIFEGAHRYRESDLAAYDPTLLREFLATRTVLRRADAPWGWAATDPAVERVRSLMRANNATHVLVLSHDPVELIMLAVPVIFADPATETALALVRRMLTVMPESNPASSRTSERQRAPIRDP